MAARFDSFGLEDLVARPEDAFRLCALAMAQGQRIRGYRGDYYRLYLGDAIVNLRTMTDPETGEEELLGMDTHAVSSCVWETKDWGLCPQEVDGERPPLGMPSKDPYICHGDPLQRGAMYTQTKRISEDRTDVWTAVVSVVNADVLTWQSLGEPLRLNMAAFPRWVEYFTSEEDYAAAQRKKPPYENLVLAPGDIYEAGTWAMSDAFMADRDHWPRRRGPEHPPLERDDVLLRGVVKDAKVGETYMGMEPMTKFLSVTVSTRFGDVELCHPFELVAEEQKDNVKPGAIVSTLCTLSGDAAIGEYAGGAVYSEEKALELLRYFFQRGGAQRLRGAMRSDGAVTFLANRQEGPDSALALLETVGQQLREADLLQCKPGTVTGVDKGGETPAPCLPGKRCLLLGDGLPGDHYAFLCLVDTDSLGRIREITITNDSRLDYEPDFPNTGEDIIHTRERLRHSMEVLEYWAVQDRKLVRDAEELWALEEVPLFRRRAEEALAAIPGDLEARLAAYEADRASDRGLGRVIHDIFQDLFCRAGGAEEDCWDVNGVFCNAPAYLLEGYDSHRKQLADELVLAQCLGLLSGRAEG